MKKGGNEGKDAKKREQDNMSNKTEMLQRERDSSMVCGGEWAVRQMALHHKALL